MNTLTSFSVEMDFCVGSTYIFTFTGQMLHLLRLKKSPWFITLSSFRVCYFILNFLPHLEYRVQTFRLSIKIKRCQTGNDKSMNYYVRNSLNFNDLPFNKRKRLFCFSVFVLPLQRFDKLRHRTRFSYDFYKKHVYVEVKTCY